jgi:hypothetical protein
MLCRNQSSLKSSGLMPPPLLLVVKEDDCDGRSCERCGCDQREQGNDRPPKDRLLRRTSTFRRSIG